MFDAAAVRKLTRPKGLPFQIGKLGHIVINVRDVAKSTAFYTQILGFEISDVYPDGMVPGGMVFMRCNADHHGVALVGSLTSAAENVELNHIAFEVPSLDDVIRARDHLKRHQVRIDFAGRRPRRLPDRGRVPRPGRAPAGDLLGHRPDRQRRARASSGRVERQAEHRGRPRRAGAGPGFEPARPLALAALSRYAALSFNRSRISASSSSLLVAGATASKSIFSRLIWRTSRNTAKATMTNRITALMKRP